MMELSAFTSYLVLQKRTVTILRFHKREGINVGAVPTFEMQDSVTAPTFIMHNIRTPMFYDIFSHFEFGK